MGNPSGLQPLHRELSRERSSRYLEIVFEDVPTFNYLENISHNVPTVASIVFSRTFQPLLHRDIPLGRSNRYIPGKRREHSNHLIEYFLQNASGVGDLLTIMTEKKCWIQADHVSPRKLLKGKTISKRAKDPKASCKIMESTTGNRGQAPQILREKRQRVIRTHAHSYKKSMALAKTRKPKRGRGREG